jgi:hypothetical protein
MPLDTLTASLERLATDVEAAPPGDHPLLVEHCRELRQTAMWEQDAPGKTARLLSFAANCLEFAADPEEAAKYLRLALGALQERARRMPTYTPAA